MRINKYTKAGFLLRRGGGGLLLAMAATKAGYLTLSRVFSATKAGFFRVFFGFFYEAGFFTHQDGFFSGFFTESGFLYRGGIFFIARRDFLLHQGESSFHQGDTASIHGDSAR